MFPDIVASVQGMLTQNQVVGGGFVLMVGGAAMAYFRNVPAFLLAALKRQFLVSVDVVNSDPAFDWVSLWLDNQPYSKKARSLIASVQTRNSDREPKVILTPGLGNHWFIYRRKLLWLSRQRKEIQVSTGGTARSQQETITITLLGRDQDLIRSLIDDARQAIVIEDRQVGVFVQQWSSWRRAREFVARPLDTVILPEGTVESLLSDVETFAASRDWYERVGVPWRRGYLLHGPPGTGKSSLISALAGELGFHLYVLNLASFDLSDQTLIQLVRDIPSGSALLLEDVDSIVSGRSIQTSGAAPVGSESDGITFSGLLNALDGVGGGTGLMVWMTSNHPERLDPALIRPGRVDVQVEFSPATESQIVRLFKQFFPEEDLTEVANEFASRVVEDSLSMADIQQRLISNRSNPAGINQSAAHIRVA